MIIFQQIRIQIIATPGETDVNNFPILDNMNYDDTSMS